MTSDNTVYLDNAASTPIFPELIAQYGPLLRDAYPNASASHRAGYANRRKIDDARDRLLSVLPLPKDQSNVVWTSGGTEANNLALLGHAAAVGSADRVSAICSRMAHPSVLAPLRHLRDAGAHLRLLRNDNAGRLDLNDLAAAIDDNTTILSFSLVQNEIGVIQDVVAIRSIVDRHAPQALLHLDATQALGKIDLSTLATGADLLTLSGHKIHGPAGVGALVIADSNIPLKPLIFGGGQQRNLRSGSLDTVGIIAMSLAAEKICGLDSQFHNHVRVMNQRLRSGITKLVDRRRGSVAVVVHSIEAGSPFIVNFSLSGYQGAVVTRALSERGIIVGAGSACSSESVRASPALKALGMSDNVAFGAIRVSFGSQNVPDDVDRFLGGLQDVVTDY